MSPRVRGRSQLWLALNDLLDATPSEILSRVQTDEAFPVVPSTRLWEATAATYWTFAAERLNTMLVNVQLDFRDPADWDFIRRDRETVTAQAVPADHDFLITTASYRISATGNLTDALLARSVQTPGLSAFAAMGDVLWFADDAVSNSPIHADGPTYQVPPPWYWSAETDDQLTWVAQSTGGTDDHALMILGLSAPPGVLPRLP